MLLGTSQDAGLPQIGCPCKRCMAARSDANLRGYAVSLAVLDNEHEQYWIIDATPDFREQVHLVEAQCPGYRLAGVLLTHAHMGHYTGLVHLGPEAWNARGLPLYLSERMLAFLSRHLPWSELIDHGHVLPQLIRVDQSWNLTADLSVLAYAVPHRDEHSDTLAFSLRGPNRAVLYCPDINEWQTWDKGARTVVAEHEIAFVDASFFSTDELPGRDLSQIPHPLVPETLQALDGLTSEINLIHLNHSNPLHDVGPERAQVEQAGFQVGQQGRLWQL